MSTVLVVQNNDLLTFDDNKLELIRKTVARDLTPVEFEFFMAVARSRGLDPIQNQIHAVVRGSGDKRKMTIQVAIDGFRLIAARTGNFAGIDAPKFLYDKNGKPERCQITVYRMVQNQRCAFVATAKWSEFVPEGNMAFMWNKMPEVMLSKVTEAQALRKAFPADLSGLYEDSEMHQADRDVTPQNEPTPPKQPVPQVASKPEAKPASRPQVAQDLVSTPNGNVVTNSESLFKPPGDYKVVKGKNGWAGKTIRELIEMLGPQKFKADVIWLSEESGMKTWREIKDLRMYADEFELELVANHIDQEQIEEIRACIDGDSFENAFPKGVVK